MIAEIVFLSLISTASGACAGDSDCANREKCIAPLHGCEIPLVGECREVKPWCPRNLSPVCTCSGKTFPNECTAIVAGERVSYRGECSQARILRTNSSSSTSTDMLSNHQDNQVDENDNANLTAEGALHETLGNDSADEAMAAIDMMMSGVAGAELAAEGAECDVEQRRCGDGLFCKFERGSCGAPLWNQGGETDETSTGSAGRRELRTASGACAVIPLGCPRDLHPVCGCDGVTYDNECIAFAAGVSVAAGGTCPGRMKKDLELVHGSAAPCTVRNASAACAETQYCYYPLGTCPDVEGPRSAVINDDEDTSSVGVCVERPTACTKEYHAVCGCDSHTHSNECEASAAGVNIKHVGVCPMLTVGASCRKASDCAAGQACIAEVGLCDLSPSTNGAVDLRNAAAAGATDSRLGVCTTPPTVCDDVGIGLEICGCDDVTYASQCTAHSAGVTVKHQGVCGGRNAPKDGLAQLPFSLPAIPSMNVDAGSVHEPSLNGIPLPMASEQPYPVGVPPRTEEAHALWSVPQAISRLFDFVVWAEEANVYAYAAPLSAWYSPRLPLKDTSTLHIQPGSFPNVAGATVNVRYEPTLDQLGGAGLSFMDISGEREACAAVSCDAVRMCAEAGDCTECLPCVGEMGNDVNGDDVAAAVGVICQTTTAARARECFAQRACDGLLSPLSSRCIIDGVAEPCPACDFVVNASEIVLDKAAVEEEGGAPQADASSRLLTGGGFVLGIIGAVVAAGLLIALFTFRKQVPFRRRSHEDASVHVYSATHAEHPRGIFMGHDEVGAYDGWSHCSSAPAPPLQGVKGFANV